MKSYNFPFQTIQDFLDNELNNKLNEFYMSFENDFFGTRIKSIDRNNMIVEFYKDCYGIDEIDYSTESFEKHITPYFKSLIYNSFEIISEGLNICFKSNYSDYNFLEKISRQYNALLKSEILESYPFLTKSILLIGKEIDHYKKLNGVELKNELLKNSPFEPKSNKRSFFHEIYDIAIIHEIIKEDFPREDFIEIFTETKTSKYLTFNCSNSFVVTFFESLKTYFNNMTATTIGNSKRFYSKNDNLFTIGTYNSTKGRMTFSNKIEELKNDLLDLL